ncbi:SRPBCC family protein [Streptomyces sp. NPDC052301]|uniref:SRPBCC family protein n=1 Tax=Streptomyces sp. NPDC052301 TaxID=3365687 RepID=UPI0037D77CC1
MSQVEESVRVDVPVHTAYNQWTQFETFPAFMEGVERIEQRTDTLTHWVTNIGGVRREFDAAITEQRPDERVAWTTVDGAARQAGVVTFHRIDESTTKVMLQLDFEPEGVTETVGDKLGLVKRRVSGDLHRFKEFIEGRGGQETGAWRGEVGGPGGGSAF